MASRINQLFNQQDADHSGGIDKQEFRHLYEAVGIRFTDKELDDQFRMYDDDGNGTISKAELQAHTHISVNGADATEHHQRALFRRFDRNRDGFLDVHELTELYNCVHGRHHSHHDAQNQLALMGGRCDFRTFQSIVVGKVQHFEL